MLAVLTVYSGQDGPLTQVTRVMSSLATVGESASRASALVLDRGTDIVASASSRGLAVSSSTMDAATAAWSGIDLLELVIDKSYGRIVADDGEVIALWLADESGSSTTKCRIPEVTTLWQLQARAISISMPVLEVAREQLVPSGTFWSAWSRATLLPSGHIALEFSFSNALFRPRWANPLWEVFELNVSAEALQISNILQRVISNVPGTNISWGELSPAAIAALGIPGASHFRWRRWSRVGHLIWIGIIDELGSLRGVGVLVFDRHALIGMLSIKCRLAVKRCIASVFLTFRGYLDGFGLVNLTD
jgi:hypothetical protein